MQKIIELRDGEKRMALPGKSLTSGPRWN